eukprot:scaffold246850_cov31-Attheya_sp.AAC.1
MRPSNRRNGPLSPHRYTQMMVAIIGDRTKVEVIERALQDMWRIQSTLLPANHCCYYFRGR